MAGGAQGVRGGASLVLQQQIVILSNSATVDRIADANDEAFFGALPADERAALMRLLQDLLPALPSTKEDSHA